MKTYHFQQVVIYMYLRIQLCKHIHREHLSSLTNVMLYMVHVVSNKVSFSASLVWEQLPFQLRCYCHFDTSHAKSQLYFHRFELCAPVPDCQGASEMRTLNSGSGSEDLE